VFETVVGLRHLLVVLRAVSRLQRLVVPAVILDDLDAAANRRGVVGGRGVPVPSDDFVGVGHILVEVERLQIPVAVLMDDVREVDEQA
jgi:hypothetical protein